MAASAFRRILQMARHGRAEIKAKRIHHEDTKDTKKKSCALRAKSNTFVAFVSSWFKTFLSSPVHR
jgi:hypothetical protein